MYSIYHNSNNKGHNLESFKEEMLQICNQHRIEKRALAFAFILYDFENHQLCKVLNDDEYWLSLNEISGEYITIFSLNYKEHKKTIQRKRQSHGFGGLQFLTNITTNMNPSKGTNELISKYFGDEIQVKYPAILFFQVDNESVIDSLLIELKEERIELAFLELKDYIKSSVKALKQISSENRENIKEIFDCLERNVESTESVKKVKRVFKNAGNLIGLIASIKGLFL
jgi:hypothetical protein